MTYKFPKFMPEGRSPTNQDIHRVAAHDPVVCACLNLFRKDGEIITREGLMACVLALADQKAELFDRLMELHWKGSTTFVLPSFGEDDR